MLNRKKDAVDMHLRDQQSGLRKERLCANQFGTLSWNNPLSRTHPLSHLFESDRQLHSAVSLETIEAIRRAGKDHKHH
ncbi:hypothetical protein DPMN_170040 [Dreissena polymorpha]|uniref:Uncharacterized protein n=1 Tax=Dreissena polymorpha TaxID=45954 RepID=A0A9D4DYS9_DREPO|nr:hypothetical protein DPMN_170040 [Dreissena polymorpha]